MRPVAVVALLLACSDPVASTPPIVDVDPLLPKLSASDVSVLYPLPPSAAEPGYLGPGDQSAHGELLPKAIYDKLPKFPVQPSEGLVYERMRVVAARFDGCFTTAVGCEAQIRLVMQPITDKQRSLDSALHLFYRVPEEALAKVVIALRKLHALAPETQAGILDVHPALVAQGMEGAYATGLRDLILQYAGEQTMVRMTFFVRAPPTREEWFFGGFDRIDGQLKQIRIVGVGMANQRVDRIATDAGYNYVFSPNPTKPEDLSALLVSETAKRAPRADLEKAAAALARIENPGTHGADDLPCAGCHITTVARAFAEKELALSFSSAEAFKSTLRTSSEAATTVSSLRAFGYFGAKPMISNRVLHETEVVVADLEARFPAK
jgi:hypothetical protein